MGLSLIGSALDEEGTLRVQLAGPGRAVVRFYCAGRPEVSDRGEAVATEWDRATGGGRVVIAREGEAEEFSLRIAL